MQLLINECLCLYAQHVPVLIKWIVKLSLGKQVWSKTANKLIIWIHILVKMYNQ